ncbi:hypothetical protein [uncultured Oscillibacter sp.]|uniref:hypothetical protein n=1 Tax=uncultured Oscillibacter sp. TaxID=876091 RepID=UPI0026706913|nr:hypothetical protein [uncultured Oscillibacter sp.]
MRFLKQDRNRRQSKFSRLRIDPNILNKQFDKLDNGAPNEAYIVKGYGNIVFMRYQENGENFITILDRADYENIKDSLWEGFNEYIVKKEDHKIYLHRVLCHGDITGMIVHHKGSRFDNRADMLEPVTPKEHDRHRTYFDDLIIV